MIIALYPALIFTIISVLAGTYAKASDDSLVIINADEKTTSWKVGEVYKGWTVEDSQHNVRLGYTNYDSYLVFKGNLQTVVKYYNRHSDLELDDFKIYFSDDVLGQLPVKLESNGIRVNFIEKSFPKGLKSGSYGVMEVVISNIKIINAATDADEDAVYVNKVIAAKEKGVVAGPYMDYDYERYKLQDEAAQQFINKDL